MGASLTAPTRSQSPHSLHSPHRHDSSGLSTPGILCSPERCLKRREMPDFRGPSKCPKAIQQVLHSQRIHNLGWGSQQPQEPGEMLPKSRVTQNLEVAEEGLCLNPWQAETPHPIRPERVGSATTAPLTTQGNWAAHPAALPTVVPSLPLKKQVCWAQREKPANVCTMFAQFKGNTQEVLAVHVRAVGTGTQCECSDWEPLPQGL